MSEPKAVRREGHSALRAKNDKLEVFDPHPATTPTQEDIDWLYRFCRGFPIWYPPCDHERARKIVDALVAPSFRGIRFVIKENFYDDRVAIVDSETGKQLGLITGLASAQKEGRGKAKKRHV